MQLLELDAHLDPQLGVEVGQRLVEQEDLRVAHDRTTERDALALSTRQHAGLAVEMILDVEDIGGVVDPLGDLRLVEFPHLQAEGHVVVDLICG